MGRNIVEGELRPMMQGEAEGEPVEGDSLKGDQRSKQIKTMRRITRGGY